MVVDPRKNKKFVFVECSDYEEYATTLFFYASNGVWSGGVNLYLNNEKIVSWYEQLIAYTGKADEKVIFEVGSSEPNKNAAYHVKLVVQHADPAGHSGLSIMISHPAYSYRPLEGSSCDFFIRCETAEIKQLGENVKNTYLKKIPLELEIKS